MLIKLKNSAKSNSTEIIQVELVDRLPAHFTQPCLLNCEIRVQSFDTYFLLTLAVIGTLTITCQRCLGQFLHHYVNNSLLAVCDSDELAEKLMIDYECIVVMNNQVDLIELLTDEIHLCCPEIHPDFSDCDSDVDKYINNICK